MTTTKELSFDFTFGVTEEQACIMCHLSSECAGCCAKCKKGSCGRQVCSQHSREYDGARFLTWMYLVKTSLPELRRFVPKKYLTAIQRDMKI